ncbi:hypothetical protein ARMGADRAFT_1079221 [Armillaria gallica]|uniref:Uncharacterized protein n=1 Tax=Armillaria gallica TaxID=47427 RepID=A0A2H3DH42_ARMGA|nr:hypothetical protein ARMGADRAFT_1079221 [Armillaria gallica]
MSGAKVSAKSCWLQSCTADSFNEEVLLQVLIDAADTSLRLSGNSDEKGGCLDREEMFGVARVEVHCRGVAQDMVMKITGLYVGPKRSERLTGAVWVKGLHDRIRLALHPVKAQNTHEKPRRPFQPGNEIGWGTTLHDHK